MDSAQLVTGGTRPAVFLTLEDLEQSVGKQVACSDWLTITQAMVDEFARVTNDAQWIHVDAARARRESPFGTTIAHGFLTLSLLTPLVEQCITMPKSRLSINYGFDRVRFIAPVRVGEEIRASFALHEVRRTSEGAQFAWNTEIRVRGAIRPSVVAVWLGRFIW